VKLFIERLGGQYRRACGEELVVTSLTRPLSEQPRNASIYSVHPTGMAVDFRTSLNSVCRHWLESTLLYLEDAGVLEATKERQPSHYHVAVFPQPYARYVSDTLASARAGIRVADVSRYMVRDGDSLWTIARSHGTTVPRLQAANDIRGSRIYAGQVLTVPSDD
jgi:nucleoid-associated protein YgaU